MDCFVLKIILKCWSLLLFMTIRSLSQWGNLLRKKLKVRFLLRYSHTHLLLTFMFFLQIFDSFITFHLLCTVVQFSYIVISIRMFIIVNHMNMKYASQLVKIPSNGKTRTIERVKKLTEKKVGWPSGLPIRQAVQHCNFKLATCENMILIHAIFM